MEMLLIKEGSKEWEWMWNQLAKHPLNEGLSEPSVAENNGETWQYMGTFRKGNLAIHEFRHRIHPTTDERELYKFTASPDFNDESIEKILPVK